ncbi:MAG: gfo/Idh/MocA family oxidoreductase [Planctomycetes bacterium]|nr:gfo/Idh/MocA family oxidoreductase [Planctomycetota bacterium]
MLRKYFSCYLVLLTITLISISNADETIIKLGMIGLDTSHVIAFTDYINNPENNTGCKIIAAYPGGSPDIPSSADRIEGFTATLRDKFDVEMVDSIEKLCEMVNGILLMSVDGRVHLKQAIPVIKAKKPLFMDKPAGGNLEDVIRIYQLAEENNVPCWSSSSLRFSPGIINMRNHKDVGKVLGCDAFGPCHIEPHHPDLYWYGIHTMEVLYTIMGTGCQTVTRIHTEDTDFAVGVWDDGRIGTFRGIRKGASPYGALVYGDKGVLRSGTYAGYEPLVKEIITFFKTGKAPVPAEETIEIYAFMSAADISKTQNGKAISIPELIQKTKQKINQ